MVDPISGARPNPVNPNTSVPQNQKKFKEAPPAEPVDPVEVESGTLGDVNADIEKQIQMAMMLQAGREMKAERDKAKEKNDERRQELSK